ncbi:MAG: LysR family transcriptional regulator [Mesorhizobium sp.]|nr:MAG: LysR family transcriptional regulator [Mesorhizobium sp.]
MAFLAVAREGSFTRAAAQLGISQSTLSHTVRALEEQLGIRLLTRTTRSVSPTEAGARLLRNIGPRFEEIDVEVEALSELREKPAGTIRLTASDHAFNSVIWPRLAKLLPDYPDVTVEVFLDNALTDIAAERFDAGVRMGESVAKDMIAVRVGPDIRFAVVGAKSYFAKRPPPMTPQELTGHICINQRFSSNGGLWVWDFERDGRELKVRVDGQIILNGTVEILEAALEGFGLAYMPEDVAQAHLDSGRLVRVLDEWSPPWPGYHLYYPSRRQTSPAFALLVNVLRYSG